MGVRKEVSLSGTVLSLTLSTEPHVPGPGGAHGGVPRKVPSNHRTAGVLSSLLLIPNYRKCTRAAHGGLCQTGSLMWLDY